MQTRRYAHFCTYYAEKFWNHYQAQGWKLSNGNAMKDWQAAFNSQWQIPKFKEDIDFFNKCKEEALKQQPQKKQLTLSDYLNDILDDYKKNWESVPQERLVTIYDELKKHSAIKLTDEEKAEAVEYSKGNVEKGKAICVRILFNRMITYHERFNAR